MSMSSVRCHAYAMLTSHKKSRIQAFQPVRSIRLSRNRSIVLSAKALTSTKRTDDLFRDLTIPRFILD